MFENYADYEYLLASSQLFLAMLGMGALLSLDDFHLELKRPRALVAGLGMQWLLVPLLAFYVSFVLPIPAGIGVGLMLVAAVPGGTLSNILTHFGKGNIALSISLTSITTVMALVTTPLLLHVMISSYLPADFSMPTGRIAQDIVLTLIVPLAIGMVLKSRCSDAFCDTFSKWVIRLSLALIVLMAVGAGGSGRLDPHSYGTMGIVALVVFGCVLQGVSMLMCWFMRLPGRDFLAIVVEATFRNMSLAVAIKAIMFPAVTGQLDPVGDAVFFTILLYGGVSLLLSLFPVAFHRIRA